MATSYTVGDGVEVRVPRTEDRAGLDWRAAHDAACAAEDAPGVCSDAVGVTVALARVGAATPADLAADGTTTPLLDDRLVYVLTSAIHTCLPAGPIGAPHSARSCTSTTFLDARTGVFLYGVDGSD